MFPLGKNTQFPVRLHSRKPGDSGNGGHKHKVRKQNSSKIQSVKKTEEAVRRKACISRECSFKNKLCFLLYGCVAEWQLLSFPSWLQQAEGGAGGILNPGSWQVSPGLCNTKWKERVIKHNSKLPPRQKKAFLRLVFLQGCSSRSEMRCRRLTKSCGSGTGARHEKIHDTMTMGTGHRVRAI